MKVKKSLKMVIQLKSKKFTADIPAEKQFQDFFDLLNDSKQYVMFGTMLFAKSEFVYAVLL